MMEFYRIVHLAQYAKKYRTRKKNKNRIKRAIECFEKSTKSAKRIDLEGHLGFANNVVFHEYGTADGEILGEAREE